MTHPSVITVRLPPDLHKLLKSQAHEKHKSLNELCVDRLLGGFTAGTALVAAERMRQVEEEGWSAEHDDRYSENELSTAGACYAMPPRPDERPGDPPAEWPFTDEWWKPVPDRTRELVKGAALIVAEIDRRLRAESSVPQGATAQ